MLPAGVKGIVYDLDGTIISTTKLHEEAWLHAGKRFGVKITGCFLLKQRGMPNDEAAEKLLRLKDGKLKKFVRAKENHAANNLKGARLCAGFASTLEKLVFGGTRVWVCSSAPGSLVGKILGRFPALRKLRGKTVSREMYYKGKPNAEPLLLTFAKMGLKPRECVYVGDALSDYRAAKNAGCKFVYFCEKQKNRDKKIPKTIPHIARHAEILKLLARSV
ncbi:MAG: HAD family phosphatase [Candidatus Micrarchaeia archaeon]